MGESSSKRKAQVYKEDRGNDDTEDGNAALLYVPTFFSNTRGGVSDPRVNSSLDCVDQWKVTEFRGVALEHQVSRKTSMESRRSFWELDVSWMRRTLPNDSRGVDQWGMIFAGCGERA